MRDPESSRRRARRVSQTQKHVIRFAKATAAKGWYRCGLVNCLHGMRHDWRSWLGKRHFTFSGIRPHVCHHCAVQRRKYEAALLSDRLVADRKILTRGPDALPDEISDLPSDWLRMLGAGISRKMRAK